MEDIFAPPRAHEKIIKSADGLERCRWLLTRYLSTPPVFIRAADGRFDGMMLDPEGRVWGVVTSTEVGQPSVQLVLYTGDLILENNVFVTQPIKFDSSPSGL